MFDIKMGLIGGSLVSLIVFFVNIECGFINALIPTSKQFLYTFIIGSFIIKRCEKVSKQYKNPLKSKIIAVLQPYIITLFLTLCLHYSKGTLHPFYSTLPTLILSPISFAYWANKKRNEYDYGN